MKQTQKVKQKLNIKFVLYELGIELGSFLFIYEKFFDCSIQ